MLLSFFEIYTNLFELFYEVIEILHSFIIALNLST
jgi:hypothetical protein